MPMPTSEPTDEELYERRWASHTLVDRQAAWEELDRRHRDKLAAYCYRITNDTTIALDCVDEAFLALIGKRRQITSSFRAYLWRTARNFAHDMLRKRPKADFSSQIADAPDPTASGLPQDLADALEACLESLRSDESEFLLLHVCDGLTLVEARNVVGWTLATSTCSYRVRRALEELRSCLKKSGFSFEKTDPEML